MPSTRQDDPGAAGIEDGRFETCDPLSVPPLSRGAGGVENVIPEPRCHAEITSVVRMMHCMVALELVEIAGMRRMPMVYQVMHAHIPEISGHQPRRGRRTRDQAYSWLW